MLPFNIPKRVPAERQDHLIRQAQDAEHLSRARFEQVCHGSAAGGRSGAQALSANGARQRAEEAPHV